MKKWAVFVFLFTTCGLALFFGYNGYKMATAAKDDRFSTESVEVNIGARGYAIPRNYLGVVRPGPEPGQHNLAVLWVLWPGLEPTTPENKHLWERRNTERQVRIHIERNGTDSHTKLHNLMRIGALPSEPVQGPHGLQFYSQKSRRYLEAENDGYQTPQGFPFVLACNDPTDEETKQRLDVELLCIAEYQLTDGAWIKVHFFEDNLHLWREIDTAARALAGSFRR